jgi:hypothetical protein
MHKNKNIATATFRTNTRIAKFIGKILRKFLCSLDIHHIVPSTASLVLSTALEHCQLRGQKYAFGSEAIPNVEA